MGAAATGKPGTNWKQVTPENRKKIGPIVRHYMGKPHPFTACVRDNTKRFGPERAKRVCAVVKDMGERRTTWRKGGKKGKVSEAPAGEVDFDALAEEVFDEVIAPVLDEAAVTVEELADWSEMCVAAGVLEAVEIDEDGDFGRVVEAAKKATPQSHSKRRSGESLGDYGTRLKKGDAALARAAEQQKKGRGGKGGDFEGKHPRKRSGEWTLKMGSSGEDVKAAQAAVGAKGDGKFGNKTLAAVRAFQKKNGLKVDGVVGRQTIAAMAGRKDAAKVKPGAADAGDRKRLMKVKRGRVRQAVDGGLADVTFRPSELVETARELVPADE